jgi:hypothetical protein
MVAVRVAQVDLVEARAVDQERAAHEADRLEGRHAAVNRDDVAGIWAELAVQRVDARRPARLDERGKDRDAGLRDPEPGLLQFVTGDINRCLVFAVLDPGDWVVGLG